MIISREYSALERRVKKLLKRNSELKETCSVLADAVLDETGELSARLRPIILQNRKKVQR